MHVDVCTRAASIYELQCTGWAKKTGPFLNVDNFAMVSGRKACELICQKFANFVCFMYVCYVCLEKSIKNLHSSVFKYSLPNLHKYSLPLKLH